MTKSIVQTTWPDMKSNSWRRNSLTHLEWQRDREKPQWKDLKPSPRSLDDVK
jgi:hypothetical protein